MNKPSVLAILLCISLIFSSCGMSNPAANVSPGPQAPYATLLSIGAENRTWRYSLKIFTSTEKKVTIQQDDCTTTYNTVETSYINDAGFKTWLDGEIASFIDGIVKDESTIQKAKQMFADKGLDKVYEGCTFVRNIYIQVYSCGGVFNLSARDAAMYRPKDEDILAHGLGRMEEGKLLYYYDYWPFNQYAEGGPKCAEAYGYHCTTKCLNLIERKDMKLGDLLRGEDGMRRLNDLLGSAIHHKEDEGTVKRPFNGISPGYPLFTLDYGYIGILFNDDNPWLYVDTPDNWGYSREIMVRMGPTGTAANPILTDDRLLPLMAGRKADEIHPYENGRKWMPDLGLGEYMVSNAGKRVRILKMNDTAVMEKINQQIGDFEEKTLEPAISTRLQASPGIKARVYTNIDEFGRFVQICYEASFGIPKSMQFPKTMRYYLLFDLETGRRVQSADVLKDDYLKSKEFAELVKACEERDKVEPGNAQIVEDQFYLGTGGNIRIFVEDKKRSKELGLPFYTFVEVENKYFDWDKWGSTTAVPLA